jgi:hypothetical protein
MRNALGYLQQAQAELEAGSHDKGGHRVSALELTRQAVSEVQSGIRYDNQNPGR